MRKKGVIFGTMLACFLILMVSNVSAVEYKTVVDTNKSKLMQEFQERNIDIDGLRESIENLNIDILKEKMSFDMDIIDIILAVINAILICIIFISGIIYGEIQLIIQSIILGIVWVLLALINITTP